MRKGLLYIIISLAFTKLYAQQSGNQYEAQVIGGKEQVEQVFQTQFTLPKVLLTSNFDVQVVASFDLDSVGGATNITFKSNLNNALRLETIRILKFFRFKRTQDESFETYPYTFTYHMSTERYNKYMKQRSRIVFKKPQPADSSYTIYSKADRSPEYYKNGEEGLVDYFLSEMEYPKLAIEKTVEGTVVVEFVVETNGYVTGITLKQGLGAGCAEEAVRLIKATKWQPALVNNKWVRYRTSYPITFSLRNTTRDASSTIGQ